MNGMIQPIRRFVGAPEIEKAAFKLREGEVSAVIPLTLGAGDQQLLQYVIIKCEGRMPEMKVNREQAEGRLTEMIVEKKLRTAAADIFQQLQDRAKGQIVNVYNDPQLSRQMPGVAATIYDRKITMRELGEECIERHGIEVLEGAISRRLLEQALKQRNQTVTQDDIDSEIARAALAMGQKTADGRPDTQAWIEMVTKEQGLPYEIYFRDSVWPSVALKILAGDVPITEEDLQKGFEANYGKRAALPHDRDDQSAQGTGSVGAGAAKPDARAVRQAGRGVFGRAVEQGASGEGAADPAPRRAAAAGKGSLLAQAGRTCRASCSWATST